MEEKLETGRRGVLREVQGAEEATTEGEARQETATVPPQSPEVREVTPNSLIIKQLALIIGAVSGVFRRR